MDVIKLKTAIMQNKKNILMIPPSISMPRNGHGSWSRFQAKAKQVHQVVSRPIAEPRRIAIDVDIIVS
jgi:hypothetical protein